MITDTRSTWGMTPSEIGKLLRISPDRVRAMIARGELRAINTAPRRGGRPRYIVLPHHLRDWEQAHQAAVPPAPARRRKRTSGVDFYPD